MALLAHVGFRDIQIAPRRYDTFSGAPSSSSAAAFGTQGIVFGAVKPHR